MIGLPVAAISHVAIKGRGATEIADRGVVGESQPGAAHGRRHQLDVGGADAAAKDAEADDEAELPKEDGGGVGRMDEVEEGIAPKASSALPITSRGLRPSRSDSQAVSGRINSSSVMLPVFRSRARPSGSWSISLM